MAVEHSLEFH